MLNFGNLLHSDLETMRRSWESARANTPILGSRKRPASTPPVEVERPRKTTSMGISKLTATSNAGWSKLEGEIDDVQTRLSGVETSLDRLHNRLENVEDKMNRSIDAQERPRRRSQRSRRLAETTAKVLQCQICCTGTIWSRGLFGRGQLSRSYLVPETVLLGLIWFWPPAGTV